MKKAQIKVGGMYSARVAGRFTTVRVDAMREVARFARTGYGGSVYQDKTVYDVTNLTTGRKLTFRSAAKFRGPATKMAVGAEDGECTTTGIDTLGKNLLVVPGCSVLPQPDEVELEHDPDLEESDTGNDDGVPVDSNAEGEQGPPFAPGTPTEPTRSPTTGGTVISAADHLCQSEASNIAQPAAPSTQSSAGFAGAIASITPPPSGRRLTEEQQAVVEQAPKSQVVVIEAGAGCGKTSTLVELTRSMPGLGQYTAFNTSLVDESRQKFPQRVPCNTIHSLAFRTEGRKHAHRLRQGRVRASEIAAMLGLRGITVDGEDGRNKMLSASVLAVQVMRAVRVFCQSADDEIRVDHFPRIAGITKSNGLVKDYLLPYAQQLWAMKCNPNATVPFSHDDYVKIWSLGDPCIAADFVLLDEAQDVSPVMLSIMGAQVRRGTRVVLVGDSAQQIYTWRGAVNALAAFPDAPRLMLSQSFRFGQVIAEVANSVLRNLSERTRLVMRGFDQIPSRLAELENPDCVLCRTNAGAVSTLLQGILDGKRPHMIGGGDDATSFFRAVRDLQAGRETQHQDLCCFTTWNEVVEFSKLEEGEDIKLMVDLVKKFSVNRILGALEDMPTEREADLVVSTAHRSKGREWGRVRLAGDFRPLDKMDDEEVRLLYVAATRAKLVLDVELCPPFLRGSGRYVTDEGYSVGGDKSTQFVDLQEARRLSAAVARGELLQAPVADPVAAVPALPAPPTQVVAKVAARPNQWTKGRNGDWLVRGAPGQIGTIEVSRRDGSASQVIIKRTVWQNDEAALYEVTKL
jgi:hypothetical protein